MAISRTKKTRKPVRKNPEEKTRVQLIKEVEILFSDIIEHLPDDDYTTRYVLSRMIKDLSDLKRAIRYGVAPFMGSSPLDRR